MWNHNADFRSLPKPVPPTPPVDAQAPDGSLLDQAARHARAGHYETALSLLDRLAQGGASLGADALDLRAKICAQLGFHLEAERCWAQAGRADPLNPLYPLALERLRRTRRGLFGNRRIGLVTAATAAVAILVALGFQQASELGAIEHRLATHLTTSQQEWEEARQRDSDLATTTEQDLATAGAAVADLAARLDRKLPLLANQASVTAQIEALNERQSQTAAELRERVDALASTVLTDGSAERAAREQARLALMRIADRVDQFQRQFLGHISALAGNAPALQTGAEPTPEPAAPPVDSASSANGLDGPMPTGPHTTDAP